MIYDPSAFTQLDIWGWNNPLGSTTNVDPMTLYSYRAHDGRANVGMIDGHVITTSETFYNKIGAPKSTREYYYF